MKKACLALNVILNALALVPTGNGVPVVILKIFGSLVVYTTDSHADGRSSIPGFGFCVNTWYYWVSKLGLVSLEFASIYSYYIIARQARHYARYGMSEEGSYLS